MSALGPHMQGPYLDPNGGRYYYCNMQTMRSEWAPEQPAPLPGQAPGQMPQYAAYPGYPGYPAYYPGAYPAAAYVPQPQPAVAAGTAAATSPTDGREICGDFKRGMCTRGDTCKYSHNVAGGTSATGAVQQQQPGGFGREECADYKRGLCNRGATCRYVHVEGFAGGGFNIGKEKGHQNSKNQSLNFSTLRSGSCTVIFPILPKFEDEVGTVQPPVSIKDHQLPFPPT